MTKKHFEAIAKVYNKRLNHYSTTEADRNTIGSLALDLANYFETENPNFDREHFLTACGL